VFRAKEYKKVESLEEAYELNQKRSNVLVGGMMWLKMGRGQKGTLIDLSGLGLDQIQEDDKEFRIGCMCSLRKLETHKGLNEYFDNIFRECTRHIVGTQFRNGATVGGSIFGRFGFSDILACMLVTDAWVELYKGGTIPLAEFAARAYDRDILVRVIIRKDGRKAAYITQRNSGTDFPVIACGVARKDGTYYFSVGARPAKAALVVRPVTGESLAEQARKAAEAYTYGDNMRAGGEYRRHLAQVYIRRLLERLEQTDHKAGEDAGRPEPESQKSGPWVAGQEPEAGRSGPAQEGV